VLRRRPTVIDVDLSRDFDNIQHSVLLDKIAKRVHDPQVLRLIKQMIKVGDHIGVPQGGPVSPLAATISLNEVDWAFDAIRRKTAEGDYEAVNSHRFADDMVITVSGHRSKRGWAQRALQCLQESLTPLGVSLHPEKTTMVDTLQGEACSFLGFDLCRVGRRRGEGHFIVITPKKSARLAIKAKMREVIRQAGATPAHGGDCLDQPGFGGMGAVCSVWPCESSLQRRARRCRETVRTLLTRRKRRRKRRIGWRRWRNAYLYEVLGLCWDWNVRYLPNAGSYK
jgi:RNA-directed DNA polymerase